MKTSDLPSIGTPFEGGFLAGLIRVGPDLFGLVVAPKAEGDLAAAPWSTPVSDIAGSVSFCDGLSNTLAMAEAGSTQAKHALELSIGGFTDWYLPSRDELELLYRNFKPDASDNYVHRSGDNPSSLPAGYPYTENSPAQTPALAFQTDGAEAFEPGWYWSSTQYSRLSAWNQYFDDGGQNDILKSYEGRARAVRRFKVQ